MNKIVGLLLLSTTLINAQDQLRCGVADYYMKFTPKYTETIHKPCTICTYGDAFSFDIPELGSESFTLGDVMDQTVENGVSKSYYTSMEDALHPDGFIMVEEDFTMDKKSYLITFVTTGDAFLIEFKSFLGDPETVQFAKNAARDMKQNALANKWKKMKKFAYPYGVIDSKPYFKGDSCLTNYILTRFAKHQYIKPKDTTVYEFKIYIDTAGYIYANSRSFLSDFPEAEVKQMGEVQNKITDIINETNGKWVPGKIDGKPVLTELKYTLSFPCKKSEQDKCGCTSENAYITRRQFEDKLKPIPGYAYKMKDLDAKPYYINPGCFTNYVVKEYYKTMPQFIQKRIQDDYDTSSVAPNPDGTYIFDMTIAVNGELQDVKYFGGPCAECAQNLLDLIKQTSTKWVPGVYDGYPALSVASFQITLPTDSTKYHCK